MGTKYLKAILIFLSLSDPLLGQTLSLSPNYGVNYGFSRGAKELGQAETYKCCMPDIGVGMGVGTEVTWEKWGIYMGYSWHTLSWGFGLQYPDIKGHQGGARSKRFREYAIDQLNLGTSRSIGKPHQLLPVHSQSSLVRTVRTLLKRNRPWEDKQIYLLQFKLRWMAGAAWNSIRYLEKTQHFESLFKLDGEWSATSNYYFSENNFSVYGGFALQFYQKDKDKLRLELLFNQGLSDALRIGLDYTIIDERFNTSGSYYAQIYTRASFLVFRASYPIVLKRWKRL